MYQNLKIVQYRFVLEAGERGLELPPFKSSAFRGGFGHVFKRLTCAFPGRECGGCHVQHKCPYIYVFETRPPEGSELMANFESVPRPYVISTEFDGKQSFRRGERLSFELLLFGNAIMHAPFFIHAFELLGHEGIGKDRRPYLLTRVEAIDPVGGTAYQVYDGKTKRIRNRQFILTGQALLERAASIEEKALCVSFETPLRMKWQGRYTSDPHFHLMVRNAVRRVTSLLYFHHGGVRVDVDFRELFKRAEKFELVDSNARWVDWERYSARQDARMNLGGIMGEARYAGDLSEFIPWLVAAEELRIGKQTAFGLGRLHLIWGN